MLKAFTGAVVRRVVDRSGAIVPEHAHDWPVLSLFVMGGYLNQAEPGDVFIADPSAVLYRAGAAHRNTVASFGFEQVEIEFDPAWLDAEPSPHPVSRWVGGRAGAEARDLARICGGEIAEEALRAGLRRFLQRAAAPEQRPAPAWVAEVNQSLRERPGLTAAELGRKVRRHPTWLSAAYRDAAGEGLAAAASRFRVERAARLLRETDLPPAQVAADSGFCDQSHMSRTFGRMLGRRPSEVRADRLGFRHAA